ncbi:mitochondrial substrate carrier protein [Metarhizium robertsii ARSEF 23]|uniref:Mitochondrial substrate carrier protein n=1 Tax=Metarhizium robertsii (strain ARSEF 23 / ATCC MYA-3075) TaxID=655844 RepID=E9FB35_METRA|nr:mitochondrial substrate carrier protein [Metarhizium robertsii ARSEF 23]EFY95035.2 mitochondrial substrate carrier protein [Metarhizium robertsii ARSEF 23]
MAREGDVESQSNPQEETPLLNGEPSSPRVDDPESEPGRGSWSYWRLFWAVLAVVVAIVFIKGWIDAGSDVDPLRTIMNYQYRFGTSFTTATQTLYHAGGLGRYYQGLTAALVQGPLARFGDTAANAGILALLQSNSYLRQLPSPAKTVFASLCAAGFRMVLTPIDTLKTTLQAQGSSGIDLLRQRFQKYGIATLWWGAFATAGATFVGHYPWFATYNLLNESIQEPPKSELFLWLLRLAFIGFVASLISDSVSNSLRVVKTYRQVNDTQVSYTEAVKLVIQEDGVLGLLGRGLATRILCNGLQGVLFSILWKIFLDIWEKTTSS